MQKTPHVKYLKDYEKPSYSINSIYLTIELDDICTRVKSSMRIKANDTNESRASELRLNGENLKLISVTLDGKLLDKKDYDADGKLLTVKNVPVDFELVIENEINPLENKALLGLYKSGEMFCTQNEAEGFRRITYYQDRPDVMARFTTKIIADKKKYPVLLSNGNPVSEGQLENGRHFVVWQDPFPKPAYLYALVAGDLGMISDEYITMSGRKIDLRIYCDKGNESKCLFAMKSLKSAMKWDEDKFGLEYDLDIFMIVAVDSFNMGAMENKGLNVFNSVLVLADSKTASDQMFGAIEGVVGHEYFHNYTGNRITCRDWFQLTLKEGLTVFRDEEFSSDMNSRAVNRIKNVETLRERQFTEDAGPTAHPVKPDSYIEIDNFYTPTVYEKGSEVIRMIHTLLGVDGFRKGMDKYFELFDGQAVTTEDFVHAMSVANNDFDFSQFEKSWYSQAGTPNIEVCGIYDESKCEYRLSVEQKLSEGQKTPYHFPYKIGLLGKDGRDIKNELLIIKKMKEEFIFQNINERPVLSVNRGFSAPVVSRQELSFDESVFLLANDNDEFARYEAHRNLASDILMNLVRDKDAEVPEEYMDAWGKLLCDDSIDDAFKALCMYIPSENSLHQRQNPIDVYATHRARKKLRSELSKRYRGELEEYYKKLDFDGLYVFDPINVGRRQLKGRILSMLMADHDAKLSEFCFFEFKKANNMTEEYTAFCLLAGNDCEQRDKAISDFYEKWKNDKLVLQRWMAAIAASPQTDTLGRIKRIMNSKDYDRTVPNIVRVLFRTFTENHINFHAKDGSGYDFIAQMVVEMDDINPNVASMLTKSFMVFDKVMPEMKAPMRQALLKIRNKENLSQNTMEIVDRILH